MVAALKIPGHPALLEVSSWHGSEVTPDPMPAIGYPLIDARRSVDLRCRLHVVYVWLWRYVQVYSSAPTTRDIATGTEMPRISAADALHDLVERGCIVLVGDGWIPVEAP